MKNLSPKKIKAKRKTVFLSSILIIIAGFCLYSNSLNGEFLWDDDSLIKENLYIKSWSNLGKVFTTKIGSQAVEKPSFYRPLQIFTYLVDYSLWKTNKRGYHFINTLLHILAALSLYYLIKAIFADELLSFLAAILFAVHPVHSETIAYISGRADPLALLFMLLCFIFYLRHLESKTMSTYIFALTSYALALLSKENSLILPVLLILYHFTFRKKLKARAFLPLASMAGIYVILRLIFLESANIAASSFWQIWTRVPGFFAAVANYLRLLFMPVDLHVDYGEKLFNFAEPLSIAGFLMTFSLLSYALMKRNNNKLVFFAIGWFFLGLLPVSNTFVRLPFYMAEHYLYLSSIGFFLILGKYLSEAHRLLKNKLLIKALIISLIAFYSLLTIRQNRHWSNLLSLYTQALKYEPKNPRVYNNLGVAYANTGNKSKAIAQFQKAIEINPTYATAYKNLGDQYSKLNQRNEAIVLFKKAIELNPDFASAYDNLGYQYLKTNKHKEAIVLFKKAIELNPDFVNTYNNLGSVYLLGGKIDEALSLYKKALKIDPGNALAHNNLGIVYYYQKKYNLSIKHFDAASKLGFKTKPEILKLVEPFRKRP